MKLIMRDYNSNSDFGEVYRLFTNLKINHLIINKVSYNSMDVFSKWFHHHLEKEFHDFKVFFTQNNSFVGFAYSYDFDPLNGHCLFTVVVTPEYQESGAGAFLAKTFLEFLFVNYNLRMVYIHVYSNNNMSLRCIESIGFNLNGLLKEYRYYNGEYVDLYIYSLTRDHFYRIVDSFPV